MSELIGEIKQSKKYPDETCSVILGNCYDEKTTAEIVRRNNSHDALVEQRDALLAAGEDVVAVFVGYVEGSIGGQVIKKTKAAIAKTNVKK